MLKDNFSEKDQHNFWSLKGPWQQIFWIFHLDKSSKNTEIYYIVQIYSFSLTCINIAKLFSKKSLILIVTDVIDGCLSEVTFPNQII